MTKTGKKPHNTRWQSDLRARVEALLEKLPLKSSETSAGEVQNLVHELRVYQAELEMQNEELRRVQLDLEDSRDYFKLLYDQSPVGYCKLDEESVIHEANLTAARLLGLDRRLLLKKKLTRFIAAESQDEFYLHRQQLFTTSKRQTCEVQMRRPGGSGFTAHLEASMMHGEPGRPAQCLVEMSDVTLQRQAEAALRESQEQLSEIIHSAMDGIITVNSQQRIVLCNEAAERMFGRRPGQLIGGSLEELIPPAARPAHARGFRSFHVGDITHRHMGTPGRLAGRRADGTEFPIEASISKIERKGGTFFTVILRDISERIRAERAVHESRAALEDFFTGAPMGLLWVGPDGLILRANREQLALLGCAEGEVVGRSFAGFHFSPDVATDKLARLAKGETLKHERARLRNKDGSVRHVLVDANGLWEQGRLVHSRWFMRDVTAYIEMQTQLLHISEIEQQRLGRELHDGLSSHLHGLCYMVAALEMELSNDGSPRAAGVGRLNQYFSEALTLTRGIAHGLQPVYPLPEGLMRALRHLADRIRTMYQVECRLECHPPVTINQPAVATHLYRIAQEAVNNAMKHAKCTRIRIKLAAQTDRIVLSVRDNGVGIAARTQPAPGMGLRTMQYRADVIQGTLLVQRHPRGGTEVLCSVMHQALLEQRNLPL